MRSGHNTIHTSVHRSDFFADPDISVNLTFSKFSVLFLVVVVVVVRLFIINCNKF